MAARIKKTIQPQPAPHWAFEPEKYQVVGSNQRVVLRVDEHRLLSFLMRSPYTAFSPRELIKEKVFRHLIDRLTVRTYIKRLRKKIDKATGIRGTGARYFPSVYDIGYYYEPHPNNYRRPKTYKKGDPDVWEIKNKKIPFRSKKLFRSGPFTLDTSTGRLFYDGRFAQLTLTEFQILHHLMQNPHTTFSRQDLLDIGNFSLDTGEGGIHTPVKRLRQKIDGLTGKRGAGLRHIVTVHKEGFYFEPYPENYRPYKPRSNIWRVKDFDKAIQFTVSASLRRVGPYLFDKATGRLFFGRRRVMHLRFGVRQLWDLVLRPPRGRLLTRQNIYDSAKLTGGVTEAAGSLAREFRRSASELAVAPNRPKRMADIFGYSRTDEGYRFDIASVEGLKEPA